MKQSIFITTILFMSFFTAFAQSKAVKSKNTIVLVHGAWSSAADWNTVIAKLKADGNEVIPVNLPGHGTDKTPVSSISLQGYVDVIKKVIGSKTDIILVGHSFGGIVISQVAEQIAPQIKKLVYIAAYVPKDGESLLSLANTDAESHVGKFLRPDEKAGTIDVAKEGIVDAFAADSPKPVQDYLVAHFRAEPLAPLATPVKLTDANFGGVNKVYVHTLNDHTIGYPLQQTMVKNANITRFYVLPSSHTAFLSLPEVVAAIISTEAK